MKNVDAAATVMKHGDYLSMELMMAAIQELINAKDNLCDSANEQLDHDGYGYDIDTIDPDTVIEELDITFGHVLDTVYKVNEMRQDIWNYRRCWEYEIEQGRVSFR